MTYGRDDHSGQEGAEGQSVADFRLEEPYNASKTLISNT